MLYLKIINTLKTNIYRSYSKLPNELKNGTEILVGLQAVMDQKLKNRLE